jgi:toxin ParE1/3/4
MTRLRITRSAQADIAAAIDYLERHAGPAIASKYADRIRTMVRRLVSFPESGAPRPLLGEFARMVIVYPYVMLYDYEPALDLLTLLRFVHGKSDIREETLRRR